MRVIICGGRDYDDYETVRAHLTAWMFPSAEFGPLQFSLEHAADLGAITIVHGDCPTGADRLADRVARELEYVVEPHTAKWGVHDWQGETEVPCYHRPRPDGRCPAAGPRRNQDMASAGADASIAFPGGDGTADMVERARGAGIPVLEVRA